MSLEGVSGMAVEVEALKVTVLHAAAGNDCPAMFGAAGEDL